MSGSLYDIIAAAESSGGSNIYGPVTSSGQALGAYQITTGTWNDFAPGAGVSLAQYPNAATAPLSVQTQVASTIPLARWAASTVAAVEQAFGGNINPQETLGQIATELGQSTPSGGASGAPSTAGSYSGTQSGASGGSGSCGLSPGCWLSALGSWAASYATRAGLIVVAIIFMVGAFYLFASRTQIVSET